ncbi:hypothetical protein [Marivita sp.]|uniref:hypothetical protein n=1 Tax=Marivita sp. TaxID=2003365 RepID=UPI003A8AEC46
MRNYLNSDGDSDLAEKLHRIIDELLRPFGRGSPRNGFFGTGLPFDVTKPNQHDSKADFTREYEIVKNSLAHVNSILFTMIDDKDPEKKKTLDQLQREIDRKLRLATSQATIETTTDLIRRNVADTGGFVVTLWLFVDFQKVLRARLKELDEQRDKFWNVPHRAPDYYARAIANRLAKLYARETGQRPTSGSSPVSGASSTSFTKALEQIFEVLGIQSGTRSPADWAIEHLTEEDFMPHQNALANLGFPIDDNPPQMGSLLGTLLEGDDT